MLSKSSTAVSFSDDGAVRRRPIGAPSAENRFRDLRLSPNLSHAVSRSQRSKLLFSALFCVTCQPLGSQYCCSDSFRGRGTAAEYLAHSCSSRIATASSPPRYGTEYLPFRTESFDLFHLLDDLLRAFSINSDCMSKLFWNRQRDLIEPFPL